MSRGYCYFWLSCGNDEAKTIAKVLLDKHLIACAKFMPVESMYWWQGSIASDNETVIVMESAEDLFDQIEAEVAKIHSYDTFVLQCIPVKRINVKAQGWLEKELAK